MSGIALSVLPRDTARRPIDPRPVQLAKRALLLLTGPIVFLFLACVPQICGKRRGFRGWYWRTVKRACDWLLWMLSIKVTMSDADRATLAADENSIIVINHRSHLDGFTLMVTVPDEKWFTFAAKKELFDARLLSTGFKGAGLVEIDRASGKVALQTLSHAVKDMSPRRSVVLFPEGTRTQSDTLGPFKAGAVLVARETGRVIRPILIHHSEYLLPHGKVFPYSGTLHVEVLEPYQPTPGSDIQEETGRLRRQLVNAFEAGRTVR